MKRSNKRNQIPSFTKTKKKVVVGDRTDTVDVEIKADMTERWHF